LFIIFLINEQVTESRGRLGVMRKRLDTLSQNLLNGLEKAVGDLDALHMLREDLWRNVRVSLGYTERSVYRFDSLSMIRIENTDGSILGGLSSPVLPDSHFHLHLPSAYRPSLSHIFFSCTVLQLIASTNIYLLSFHFSLADYYQYRS
jgi:hypothetical protein